MKYKIEQKFHFIHYVYSLLHPKIYNRTVDFGIQEKSNFDFSFQKWRLQKKNEPIGHKTIEELPAPTKQLLIPDVYLTEKVQKIIKTEKLMKMNRFLQTNKKVPVLLYQKFFLKREI